MWRGPSFVMLPLSVETDPMDLYLGGVTLAPLSG
jgi:hypothetical protein